MSAFQKKDKRLYERPIQYGIIKSEITFLFSPPPQQNSGIVHNDGIPEIGRFQ